MKAPTTDTAHATGNSRDAPIISRLLCWYRPIVIYYAFALWWHWIRKLHFFNGRHKFSFYSYICKLGKHAGKHCL